jgi:hypothetical protein
MNMDRLDLGHPTLTLGARRRGRRPGPVLTQAGRDRRHPPRPRQVHGHDPRQCAGVSPARARNADVRSDNAVTPKGETP